MNRVLIDTNIYSEAMRGNPDVIHALRYIVHIGIASISIGEPLSGFKAGNKEQDNRKELGIFLDSARVTLYPVHVETADHYS